MKRQSLLLLALVFGITLAQAQQNKNDHTFLGVDVNTVSGKSDGLYLNGVYKGFGAEKAGLKPGDILRTVNDKPVRSFDELVATLDNYKPGEQVELSFIRNNSTQTAKVSLSNYPDFLKYNRGDFNKDGDSWPRHKATLGVHLTSMWEQYALLVTGFPDDSPAKNAGLQVGDVVLKMDNWEFVSLEELNYALSKYKPNAVVTLTIKRDGQQKLVPVTLGDHVKEQKEMKEKKENKEKKKEIKLI